MAMKIKNSTLKGILLPVYLLIYFLLIVVSLFVPTSILYKIYRLIGMEENIITILNKNLTLKIFALIITMIIYGLYKVL